MKLDKSSFIFSSKQWKIGSGHLLLLIVFLVGLLALDSQPALACSCAPAGSPGEELEGAAAVFAGKVIALDVPGPVNGAFSTADPVKVTFRVSTLWKGPSQQMLVVHTVRSEVSCGYEFQLGQEYLVYAAGSENHLQTGLCSRTRRLDMAEVDKAELGEGISIPEEAPASPPSYALPIGIIVVSLTSLVIILRMNTR